MVANSNYGLDINHLEGCPFCGHHILKQYENSTFMAVQCTYCLAIGGVLPHGHFQDSEYLKSSRWQLVYIRWNERVQ